MPRMISVLRRPRWIALGLIVAVIVGLFVTLGFWQLSRLDARRLDNVVLASRIERGPVSIEEVTAAGLSFDDLAYTRVSVSGAFDPDALVMVRNQTHNTVAGAHAVVPLLLGDNAVADAVLVNIGWLPLDGLANPSDAPIVVEGFVRASQVRPAVGQVEPDGVLKVVNRVDIPRLQQQMPYALAPFWIQLIAPDDPASPPIPVPPPDLGEGSHMSYAVQWFSFAAISVIGFGALLRREATKGGGGGRRGRSYVVDDDGPATADASDTVP